MASKKRRTPQEKKALSYAKDTRGHHYDSPNVKFARKLKPLRTAQENRRRRRVYNARTAHLAEMDDEAVFDVEAGELEQDLGRLGKRGPWSYGPFTLGEHVKRQEDAREGRRIASASWQWTTCPQCGWRWKKYVGPPEDSDEVDPQE